MASPVRSPERNLEAIERELGQGLLLLKNTAEPERRREILRKLRLLLREADDIVAADL